MTNGLAVLAGWLSEADRIHVRALVAAGDHEGLRRRGYGPIQARVLVADWDRGVTDHVSPPVTKREERRASGDAA